jgi:hypothetical protein
MKAQFFYKTDNINHVIKIDVLVVDVLELDVLRVRHIKELNKYFVIFFSLTRNADIGQMLKNHWQRL